MYSIAYDVGKKRVLWKKSNCLFVIEFFSGWCDLGGLFEKRPPFFWYKYCGFSDFWGGRGGKGGWCKPGFWSGNVYIVYTSWSSITPGILGLDVVSAVQWGIQVTDFS